MPTRRHVGFGQTLFDGEVRRARPGGHFARFAPWSGIVVLDHGCGDAFRRGAVEARGALYVGLDPYSDDADLRAPGEAMPLKDASVDVVISHGVLHLVPHVVKDMAEIARVLRPGGRLLGYVAFTESFQESSTLHVSHRGLEQLCRDAGLVLDEIEPTAYGLDYHLAEVLLPFGMLGPVRRALRAAARTVAAGVMSAWAALLAARSCALRRTPWSEWNALRRKWRWYFALALASGYEFAATKPGTWTPRTGPTRLDDLRS